METETVIFVETKKFRTFVQKLCEEYNSDIVFEIDGNRYTEKDFEWLISTWANRKTLNKTIDFTVKKDGKTIFSFHDSPNDLIADESQMAFLDKLRNAEIVKYEIHEYPRPKNILQKILWSFKSPKPISIKRLYHRQDSFKDDHKSRGKD